jgi:hypothetical protein
MTRIRASRSRAPAAIQCGASENQATTKQLRHSRDQLGRKLRELGYPISDSLLDKLCAPSVGQGPPVAGWWGRRPLYDLDDAIAWAESRLSPVAPEPRRRMPMRSQVAPEPRRIS